MLEEPDFEWSFIDGTYVKAHQHSTGAASAHSEGLGKSRAGLTSKTHLAVDAQDLPVAFEVTGGDVHDSAGSYSHLVPKLQIKAMTVNASEIRSNNKEVALSFHVSATQLRVMRIWIEAYIAIGIGLRMPLHG